MSKKKVKRIRRKETESQEIRDKANDIWQDPNLSSNKVKK